MDAPPNSATQSAQPAWKPLPAKHRRILGVLVEKAKTTPNNYPLSLNAICTGSNQKSNRDPYMEIEQDDAEDVLDQLREWGAVGEVHGDGRVIKYRHYMKDWLGVDGNELAIMAELLLRGAQTVGELRARAARMAGSSLPDMASLKPLLANLMEKGLVVALSPEGRGQVVTHALYLENEMTKVRSQTYNAPSDTPEWPVVSPPSAPSAPRSAIVAIPTANSAMAGADDLLPALQSEIKQLQDDVAKLKREVEDIWSSLK